MHSIARSRREERRLKELLKRRFICKEPQVSQQKERKTSMNANKRAKSEPNGRVEVSFSGAQTATDSQAWPPSGDVMEACVVTELRAEPLCVPSVTSAAKQDADRRLVTDYNRNYMYLNDYSGRMMGIFSRMLPSGVWKHSISLQLPAADFSSLQHI